MDHRILTACGAFPWAVLGLFAPLPCGATTTPEGLTTHQPGYVVTALGALPSEPLGLDLDAAGNLYFPTAEGIYKVTPGGSSSLWSDAFASDLAFTSDGSGYGADGSCHCITSFDPGGTSSILQDSLQWSDVNLGSDGVLYGVTRSPFDPGYGVYQIDRSTGQASLLTAGRPLGGTGRYGPMATGTDGKLHSLALGVEDGTYGTLLRLDGTQFTPLVSIPNPLWGRGAGGALTGLVAGPSGTFYASTLQETLAPQFVGFVYTIDLALGTAEYLVSGYNSFFIGYDGNTGTLYVAETSRLKKIWAITKDPSSPAQAVSWGRVKALYRGERVSSSPVPVN